MAGNMLSVVGSTGAWEVVDEYTAAPAAATALVLTGDRARAKAVLITTTGQSIRVRLNGTDPTASVGYLVAVDDWFFYEGELNLLEMIQTAATAAVLITLLA